MAAPTISRGNSAAREVTKQLVTSADLLLHYCSNIIIIGIYLHSFTNGELEIF